MQVSHHTRHAVGLTHHSHQHRHMTAPRACWLWGNSESGRQAPPAAAAAASSSGGGGSSGGARTAPAQLQPRSTPTPSVAMRAVAEQQPTVEQATVVLVEPAPLPAKPQAPLDRSWFDVMRFNGPGPELIQGRLAMIAMVVVPRQEMDSGATVLQQAVSASPWVWAGLALWVWASLVPMLKGARHEAFGFFTPRAELLNGRAAMLGFAILAVLEHKAGVPFF